MLLVHMINFNQSECILFRSRMIPLKKALWLDVASPHDEFEPIRVQYFVVEWLLYSENSLWDWLLVLVMLPVGNMRRLTARGKIGNDFELFLCHLRTSLVFLNAPWHFSMLWDQYCRETGWPDTKIFRFTFGHLVTKSGHKTITLFST